MLKCSAEPIQQGDHMLPAAEAHRRAIDRLLYRAPVGQSPEATNRRDTADFDTPVPGPAVMSPSRSRTALPKVRSDHTCVPYHRSPRRVLRPFGAILIQDFF